MSKCAIKRTMQFPLLTEIQKQELETRHRRERDKRVCDRIKAVLLKSEGWPNRAIAQALRVREETVHQHLSDWLELEKLKPENGGSKSKLNLSQSGVLRPNPRNFQICWIKGF